MLDILALRASSRADQPFCLCITLAFISLSTYAEGTREFAPGNTQDDTVTNILMRYQDTPTSAGVGYFGAEADRRIYFYVKDFHQEIVTLGLPWRSTGDEGIPYLQ